MLAFWERRTTPCYRHITAESPWALDAVRRLTTKAELEELEYGVESDFFDIQRDLTEKPSCLYCGSLVLLKGVDHLIKAFADPALKDVTLYMAGDGEMMAELQSMATPNVVWLGSQHREQVREWMGKAWCLVHPTLADTGPTVMKEARVAGMPIVTTTENGSKQYVVEGQSGYIVPPRDADALRDAVLKVVSSREHAREMGEYGKEECREKLTGLRTYNTLMSIYDRILSGER